MSLKANEYPDIWRFSKDCPSPPRNVNWVASNIKVKKFINVFLTQTYFGKIIFWRYPSYAGAGYFINDKTSEYYLLNCLTEADRLRYAIEKQAETGHLSVFFVPLSPDDFIKEILCDGHYGKHKEIVIGLHNSDDPLDWEHGQNIAFIESDIFNDGERIFTFSHDAEYLYEIFR